MNNKNWIGDCISVLVGANHYCVDGLHVIAANTGVDFPCGTHSHEEFELMMPLLHDVEIINNGKFLTMKKGMIMPFNPYDKHGLNCRQRINNFLCILVSKDYFNNFSNEIFLNSTPLIFENLCFKPSNNLNYLIGAFIDESNCCQEGYEIMQHHLAKLICIELIRSSQNNILKKAEKQMCPSILRAVKYLEEHYNLPYDLEETAKVSKLNKYHFLKLFYNNVGMTPKDYLTKIKIEKAKSMLLEGDKTVSDLAYELGYSSQSHFCMTFKKHCKITPTQFKNSAY